MNNRTILIGVLILALLAVCAGIGVIGYFTLAPFRIGDLQIGSGNALNVSAKGEEQGSFPVSGPAFVKVETSFGDIQVTGADVSEIQVTAQKTAWAANQQEADQALKDLKVVMEQDGNNLSLRVDMPSNNGLNNRTRTGSVNFVITAPRQTTVSADTSSGQLELSGLEGKADLNSKFGEVQVSDFKGGLAVHAGSGKITARRISLLDSGNGDITLKSDFGDVSLDDAVAARAEISSGSGKLSLTNLQSSGVVTLNSSFGNLDFKTGSASELTAETRSGKVTLSNLTISGPVTAHSDFGDVSLVQVDGQSYDLSSNSGQVTADGAKGSIKAHSDFGGIEVTGGKDAILDLETNSGKIVYRGSLADGDQRIKTSFGNVEVGLPKDSPFHFDLKTGFGEIECDFKIQIEGTPDEKHWVGMVGSGGPALVVETQNGSISITMTD
jgi:DUF4097 and DUF4098 domain-containing protein YvlB